MKRAVLERSLVVVLFVLVMVIFSFAERDSKKMGQMYNITVSVKKASDVSLARLQAEPSRQK